MSTSNNILITGSSGYVAMHLRNLGFFSNAKWISRTIANQEKNIIRVRSYDDELFSELLHECDAIIHLAAVTRSRTLNDLALANIDTTIKIHSILRKTNNHARFIFISSDLANSDLSPYGISKKQAEDSLLAAGGNIVCLRCSQIVSVQLPPDKSIFSPLKKIANAKIQLLPGKGLLPVYPLWIADFANILNALVERKKEVSDYGIWNAYGDEASIIEIIDKISALSTRKPIRVGIPLSMIIAVMKIIAMIHPSSTLPLDYFESINKIDHGIGRDIFSHLSICRTPIDKIIELYGSS